MNYDFMEFENQIICGDCLDVMKDWPDGCVDLVLTDPQYGIDISEEYCQIARDGLRAVDTGVPVIEARAGQRALFV